MEQNEVECLDLLAFVARAKLSLLKICIYMYIYNGVPTMVQWAKSPTPVAWVTEEVRF